MTWAQADSTFTGYLYNEEYQVYIKMNFYEKDIKVPNQEIFGNLPGYFGAKRDNRLWLITSATAKDKDNFSIDIINDYGSEDLTATLSYCGNGKYIFRQIDGSTLKIVVKNKWVKIPKELTFTKTQM